MARPGSSYMQEAPPGYRWKTVTKINAMGRPYTTRILVPITEQQAPPVSGFMGEMPPQTARKKDITTVIKEYADDTPNTKTTTIKGGFMGDVPTGQDDPQDERGMGMWNADMAQLRARQQQGTAAPSQQEIQAALGGYGDARRSQFTPPPPQPPQYPPQASGALPPPPPADPRFQMKLPGQMQGMVDPSWSAAVPGSNVPPTVKQEVPPFRPPPWVAGLRDPNQLPASEAGRNVPPISPRVAERRQQYADQELQRMAPPPESRPVDTGSSIADARIAAIADANRFEADEEAKRVAADDRAKKSRLAQAEIPSDYGQDDPAGYEGWSPGELDQYMEVQKQRRLGLESPHPSMAIDPKDMAGYRGERPGTPTWAKELADVTGILLPVDLIAGGLNKILGMLGAPDEALEDPVLGRQWIMRNAEKVAALVNKGKEAAVAAATDQPPIRDAWLDKVDEWRERRSDRIAIGEDMMDAEEMARAGMPDPQPPIDITSPQRGRSPLPPRTSMYPKQEGIPVGGPPVQADRGGARSAGVAGSATDATKMAANPNLEKIWGKFAYDPAARKKYYLDGMKDIYKKAMLLNLIALATGGESQAEAFIKAKTGELKLIDKFDEEERITNIWKEVFTDANGNPYMPKTKREAAERAGRTGAQPQLISSIFGSVPEAKKKTQYYREDQADGTKWEVKRFDSDPGPGWIEGTPRSTSPRGDQLLADKKLDRYNQLLYSYQNATGDDKEAALRNLDNWASFAKLNTGGITAQQNRTFAEKLWKAYFHDESGWIPGSPTFAEYFYGGGEFQIPHTEQKVRGYGAEGGGQTTGGEAKGAKSFNTEAEAEAAEKAGTLNKGDKVIINGVPGTWE